VSLQLHVTTVMSPLRPN